MGATDTQIIDAAKYILSAAVGGIASPVILHILNRGKNAADQKKVEVETDNEQVDGAQRLVNLSADMTGCRIDLPRVEHTRT